MSFQSLEKLSETPNGNYRNFLRNIYVEIPNVYGSFKFIAKSIKFRLKILVEVSQ